MGSQINCKTYVRGRAGRHPGREGGRERGREGRREGGRPCQVRTRHGKLTGVNPLDESEAMYQHNWEHQPGRRVTLE